MSSRSHTVSNIKCGPVRRRSFLGLIDGLFALRRQRIQLAEMDDRILRDIGISRSEALREADRPVWDAPHHWMK